MADSMATRPSQPEVMEAPPRRDPAWVVPAGESQGLVSYVEAVRDGRWIIIGSLIACLGMALLYLAQASKVYETSADLQVFPQSDLPVNVPVVIRGSSDPTRDVETVARLVTSAPVARRVI